MNALSSLLLVLKALLPALEPTAQAALDQQLTNAEASIAAASGTSPDIKIVEEAAVAMVKAILDAEGARLLAKA